jgi:hypothetical protein
VGITLDAQGKAAMLDLELGQVARMNQGNQVGHLAAPSAIKAGH